MHSDDIRSDCSEHTLVIELLLFFYMFIKIIFDLKIVKNKAHVQQRICTSTHVPRWPRTSMHEPLILVRILQACDAEIMSNNFIIPKYIIIGKKPKLSV